MAGTRRTTDWTRFSWAAAPVALVYLAHAWFGANSSFAALTLAALEALLLAAFLARSASRRLLDARFAPLLALLVLVLAAVLATMTGLPPGGAHPVWSYVQAAPAVTIDRAGSLIELFKLLGLACILLVGVLVAAESGLAEHARRLLVWGGGAFCLWMLLVFLGGSQLTGGRLMGGFGSPNSAATVVGVLILLALPDLARAPAVRSDAPPAERVLARAPQAGLLLLFAGCFLLTASRWGSASLAAALLVFLVAQLLSGRMKLVQALAAGALVAVAAALLLLLKGQLLVERMGSTVLDQDARGAIFAVHWDNFLRAPLFGDGLGTFAAANRMLLDAANFPALGDVRDLHNVYLQWLEEAGVVGAAPMFLLVAAVIGLTVWSMRGRRRGRAWLNALLAADVMVLAHGLSDFALQTPSIAAFWALLLGLQLGGATAPRGRGAGHV